MGKTRANATTGRKKAAPVTPEKRTAKKTKDAAAPEIEATPTEKPETKSATQAKRKTQTRKREKAGGTAKTKPEKPAVLSGTVPEWSSAAAVAQLLGKSVRRVQQLTQEGVLETEVPPGGGARKYRTCQTIQRYIAHVEEKAQETGENSRQAELTLKKLEAEVELKESQGQLHRLKTAIAEGKYISADQATEELAEFMAMFKKFALNIPPRIAGTIAGYADAAAVRAIEKSTRKELEAMLAAFTDAATVLAEEPEQ